MSTLLVLGIHTLEIQMMRLAVRLAGIRVPPIPSPTPAQRRIADARIRALVPHVPVDPALRLPRRIQLHLVGLFHIAMDLLRMQRRKLSGDDRDFPPEVRAKLEEYPPYYRRNYHHQTDGYLSYASARRYDVQLELVFLGLGERVRRVGASQLRRFLSGDGAYRFLECGAGTGELGAILQRLYPHADLLLTDPSPPYLRFAKEKYPHLQIRDVPTFMEDLDFVASGSLDGLCSSFVFHELPAHVRPRALAEAHRVLKDGGYLMIVDSGQDTDDAEGHFALDHFQQQFYEPYFDHYRAHAIEDACRANGFEVVHRQPVFFSKVVIARKIAGSTDAG